MNPFELHVSVRNSHPLVNVFPYEVFGFTQPDKDCLFVFFDVSLEASRYLNLKRRCRSRIDKFMVNFDIRVCLI